MWLRLVPVSGDRVIVAQVVGMAVFDAHPDGSFEVYGVLDVEAVE